VLSIAATVAFEVTSVEKRAAEAAVPDAVSKRYVHGAIPVAALYGFEFASLVALMRHIRCSGLAADVPAGGVIAAQAMFRPVPFVAAVCPVAIACARSGPRNTCRLTMFTVVPVAALDGVTVTVLLASLPIAKRYASAWLMVRCSTAARLVHVPPLLSVGPV